MYKILVTGASGFIGQYLCKKLNNLNFSLTAAVRNLNYLKENNNIQSFPVNNIDSNTDWKNSLINLDCIIHCAGIAHNTSNKEEIDNYRIVNVEGTKHLATQAAKAGVKRIIFLSTIKVNGESTNEVNNNKINDFFSNDDPPNPQDAYALSKLEAEKELWKISKKTNLEVVVLRLPLVYGHGVKGNMANLIKLIKFGIPLPFGMVRNQKSLISIYNLVDLLIKCIDHPNANGKTFLVSDCEDVSTPSLINLIAFSLGRTANIFSIPLFLLKMIGKILGKKKEIDKLIASLIIDSSYTCKVLNWKPPISVAEGIRRMVQGK